MKKLSPKRIALDGVLTAIALILHVVEQYVPMPLPIPGIKLGLGNVATLFAMFSLGPVDALIILLVRIFVGSLFAGQVTALLYSLVGGVLCYIVTFFLSKILTEKQIWFCGFIGAVFHVLGQMAVALLLTNTPALLYYLPVLVLSAIVTGLFTGSVTQFVFRRLKDRTNLLS